MLLLLMQRLRLLLQRLRPPAYGSCSIAAAGLLMMQRLLPAGLQRLRLLADCSYSVCDRRPTASTVSAPDGPLLLRCLCPMTNCSYSVCARRSTDPTVSVPVGPLRLQCLCSMVHCSYSVYARWSIAPTVLVPAGLLVMQLIRNSSSCISSAPATRADYACLQLVQRMSLLLKLLLLLCLQLCLLLVQRIGTCCSSLFTHPHTACLLSHLQL